MARARKFKSWRSAVTLCAGMLASVAVWISFFSAGSTLGQTVAQNSMISGKVTADQGVVRAFRVRAKDTVRKITYTVFTNKGRYQIFNLPAGSYEVSALQEGFESPVQQVQLKAGGAETADLTLKAKPPEKLNVDMVDFDAYLPPGRGRDVFMNRCSGCHGVRLSSAMTGGNAKALFRSEAVWRSEVSRMLDRGYGGEQKAPKLDPAALSSADREEITKYLAVNFAEDSKPRDLKIAEPVLDEDELAKAIYIQYELPPGRSGGSTNWPSKVSPTIWFSGGTSIMAMDLNKTMDYPDRYREWMIPQPDPSYRRAPQHTVVEMGDGHVYWVELRGTAVGELDPKTGEMKRYPSPSGAGMHTAWPDSKGRIWYSSIFGPSVVGMFDTKTKKITEFDPSPDRKGGGWYGIVVDRKDRVWAAGTSVNVLASFDPKTEKWTPHFPPQKGVDGSEGAMSSGPRRPTLDSKGRIWFSMTGATALGMFDPESGKFNEYTIPFRYSMPYECWADNEDNVWLDLGWGQKEHTGLARFDPKTEKFTFFPYPNPDDHNAKISVDQRGILWMGTGRPSQLTSFRPKGNVPSRSPATN